MYPMQGVNYDRIGIVTNDIYYSQPCILVSNLTTSIFTCSLSLLLYMVISSTVSSPERRKKCVQKHCGQARFIISNVTKEIVISGCPRCTECSVQNQEIWQSWWYYYYENGTRSPDQNGVATGGSNYSIDVRTCVAQNVNDSALGTFLFDKQPKTSVVLMHAYIFEHKCMSTVITSLLMVTWCLRPFHVYT